MRLGRAFVDTPLAGCLQFPGLVVMDASTAGMSIFLLSCAVCSQGVWCVWGKGEGGTHTN